MKAPVVKLSKLDGSAVKLAKLNGTLFVFEFFGLQYFSLKQTLRENFKDRISNSRKIFFSFLILFNMLLGFSSMLATSFSQKVTTKNVLTLVYSQSTTYFFFIAIWISLVQSFVSTVHLKKLFANSKKIAEICNNEFGTIMSFEAVPRSMRKRYAVETLILVIVYSVNGYFRYLENKLDILWLVVSIIHASFFILVVNKFLFYVGLINFQLEFTEKLLASACTFKAKPLNKKIYFLSDYELPSKSSKNSKCQEIFKIYNKILENGSLTNKSCGCSILVVLVNIIGSATYCGYVLCAAAMGDSSEDIVG